MVCQHNALVLLVPCRDLKMDNTLLDDNDPPRVKLCDFGFAKWWTDKPCMNTITGTQSTHEAPGPGAGRGRDGSSMKQPVCIYQTLLVDIMVLPLLILPCQLPRHLPPYLAIHVPALPTFHSLHHLNSV
jgi:serine/threonine protein kinase